MNIFAVSCLLFALLNFAITEVDSKTALIIVDVQNCFLSGGSLAVTNGNDVIPVINWIRSRYDEELQMTILTQDWHCSNHVSFVTQHQDQDLFSVITLYYDELGNLCRDDSCVPKYNVTQTMWPEHCVMNTDGAKFSSELDFRPEDVVVRKGYNCDVDSYSGFYDNGRFSHTELEGVLRNNSIKTLIITGLALDYCVYYTAKDAHVLGFNTYLVEDASRPVDNKTGEDAIADLKDIGVKLINSRDLGRVVFVSSGSIVTYHPLMFSVAVLYSLLM